SDVALRGGAVDAQGVAADKGRRVGQQETDRRGDFRFLTHAFQRHGAAQGADGGFETFRVGVHAAGSNPARRYRVDAHAGAAPFKGGGLGEVVHAGAGGAGVPHAGHAAPHVGDDVDDAAAVA